MQLEPVTILGLCAAFCTTASFAPQAIKSLKTKHTKDLSLGMYILLTVGIALWLLYGIGISDLPIIIANAIAVVLSTATLIAKLKYG